jgi:hypothetical protein
LVDDKEFLDRIDRFQSQSISFIVSNDEPEKRKIPAHIKEKVKGAAGEQCPICKTTMISSPPPKQTPLDARESTPDHIVDLDLGGKNTEENFLIICHKCNWAKNHAKQRYLNTPGIHGGTPGHPAWRAAFRSKGSNIAKLLEYVEWSFRIEEPSSEHRFPELHGYFMQDRFDKSEEPKSKIEKTPDNISQTPTISELDKRLEKLENTMWKRFTRFISRPFRRKQKTAPKKTIEEPKARRSKPINSVEKFELDTWIDENWQGEQSYIQLRDAILAHEEGNNGERPLKDILKDDFGIPKRWTIAQKSSYWGESKHPSVENSQEGPQSTSSQYPLIPKFNQAATGLRLPREPEQLSEVIVLNEVTDNDMDPKERNQKIAGVVSIGQARVMRTIWHIGKLSDNPNPPRGGRKVLKALEELVSEGRQWDEWDESEREQITQYFSRAQDHMAAQHPLTSDDENKDDSKEGFTDIRPEGISEFKHIIKEILALEDNSIVTVSAMGQRFSKEIQSIGYYNKKDFFRQNGIDHNLTIQQAIIEFFDEEEVTIEITRGVKCVVLNRRD